MTDNLEFGQYSAANPSAGRTIVFTRKEITHDMSVGRLPPGIIETEITITQGDNSVSFCLDNRMGVEAAEFLMLAAKPKKEKAA